MRRALIVVFLAACGGGGGTIPIGHPPPVDGAVVPSDAVVARDAMGADAPRTDAAPPLDGAVALDGGAAPDATPPPTGPTLIETLDGDVDDQYDAVDSDGDVYVAFRRTLGTATELWAVHQDHAGWSAPVQLSGEAVIDARAAAAGDTAIVVWTEATATGSVTLARRAVAGTWGAVETVSTNPEADYLQTIAIDAAGQAVVLSMPQSPPFQVVATRYQPGAGWGTPTRLDTPGQEVVPNAIVALAPDGTAFVAWTINDLGLHVRATRATATGAWDPPVALDDGGLQDLVVDPNGVATAIWNASSNRTAVYTPGTGWSVPSTLTTDTGVAALAVDGSGVVTAMWTHFLELSGNQNHSQIVAARRVGSTWSAPVVLGDVYDLWWRQLAARPDGHVIALWQGYHHAFVTADYAPGAGWAGAVRHDPGTDTYFPALAIGDDGTSCVAWHEQDADSHMNLWALLDP